MIRRNRLRTLALLAPVLVAGMITAPAVADDDHSGHDHSSSVSHQDHSRVVQRDLTRARIATLKYISAKHAVADGYAATVECVASPLGAMGMHYVNGPMVGDPSLNVVKPEILLYEQSPWGPRLIGVEYMLIDRDQDLNTADDRPSLFGVPFDGPMLGHSPGMPIHYDLHVWLWKHNPSGMFAQFNPRVHCP